MTTNYPHYIIGNASTKLEMNESQTKMDFWKQCAKIADFSQFFLTESLLQICLKIQMFAFKKSYNCDAYFLG